MDKTRILLSSDCESRDADGGKTHFQIHTTRSQPEVAKGGGHFHFFGIISSPCCLSVQIPWESGNGGGVPMAHLWLEFVFINYFNLCTENQFIILKMLKNFQSKSFHLAFFTCLRLLLLLICFLLTSFFCPFGNRSQRLLPFIPFQKNKDFQSVN